MIVKRMLGMAIAVTALLATPTLARAQDANLLTSEGVVSENAISHPANTAIGTPSSGNMIASLAVLNAKGASLDGNTLTLTGVSPNSIVFADRPVHAAGHVLTAHFIREWDEGIDSFAKNPPNATVSVLGSKGDAVEDAVVVLKSPKLDGDTLTFNVDVLEGQLKDADGAAALFIDHFAVHGVGPRGRHFSAYGSVHPWRGAWYGRRAAYGAAAVGVGLAAGAALSHPYGYGYGYPTCGYYPYPPCPAY